MSLQQFDLTNKVAVVTGGARGLGRAIAEGLAQAGANVVIGDINFEECQKVCSEIEKLGVKAVPVRCDVSKTKESGDLIRRTIKEFDKVDILVNNAGITGSGKAVIDMSDEEWHKTLSINLTGIFLCSRAAAKEMIKQNKGKIINITSVASFQPITHSSDYCASKGGALMLTKVLALELIKYNIQVNAICPGYFDTQLAPILKERVERNIKRMVPIGRLADVEEIKGLAVFLASWASDYLVGSAIPIDGGVLIRS
jgi:gluconate 5-dehydrogenase